MFKPTGDAGPIGQGMPPGSTTSTSGVEAQHPSASLEERLRTLYPDSFETASGAPTEGPDERTARVLDFLQNPKLEALRSLAHPDQLEAFAKAYVDGDTPPELADHTLTVDQLISLEAALVDQFYGFMEADRQTGDSEPDRFGLQALASILASGRIDSKDCELRLPLDSETAHRHYALRRVRARTQGLERGMTDPLTKGRLRTFASRTLEAVTDGVKDTSWEVDLMAKVHQAKDRDELLKVRHLACDASSMVQACLHGPIKELLLEELNMARRDVDEAFKTGDLERIAVAQQKNRDVVKALESFDQKRAEPLLDEISARWNDLPHSVESAEGFAKRGLFDVAAAWSRHDGPVAHLQYTAVARLDGGPWFEAAERLAELDQHLQANDPAAADAMMPFARLVYEHAESDSDSGLQVPREVLQKMAEVEPLRPLVDGLLAIGSARDGGLLLGPSKTDGDHEPVIASGRARIPASLATAVSKLQAAEKALAESKTQPPSRQAENNRRALRLRALKEMKAFRKAALEKSPLSQSEAEALARHATLGSSLREAYGSEAALQDMADAIRWMGGQGFDRLNEFVVLRPRAFATADGTKLNAGEYASRNEQRENMFHELGHIWEGARTAKHAAALGWRAERTRNAPLTDHYGDQVKDGGFIDRYVGRIYDHPSNPTEVLSMGMEHFVNADRMLDLMVGDEAHFALMVGLLPQSS